MNGEMNNNKVLQKVENEFAHPVFVGDVCLQKGSRLPKNNVFTTFCNYEFGLFASF